MSWIGDLYWPNSIVNFTHTKICSLKNNKKKLTKLWAFAWQKISSSVSSLDKLALNCWMYIVANLNVSNFDNFVSAGTHGNLVFNRQNALDSTRILARSRALAAFRWIGGCWFLEPNANKLHIVLSTTFSN